MSIAVANNSASQASPVQRFPADKFIHIPAVVVFAEHSTQLRDGTPVTYDRQALEQIAANCNRRIEETGNYAAVCVGHTDSSQGGDKPLIGFAGPFRVEERNGRAVIVADLHIFKQDKEKLQRYPRPSPEVWIPREGFDPQRIFLDPIAMLGAEMPRLDMGLTLLYQERDGETLVERYAAVLPAASNTFVPSSSNSKKEEYGMANEELVQEIIQALEQLDWVQWTKRKMAEEQAASGANQEAREQLQERPSDKVDPEKAKQILEDGKVHGQPLTEEQRKMFGAAAGRERDSAADLRERYHLLQQHLEQQRTELERLRQDVELERASRVNAERYSQLVQLRQLYAFDLEKEVERCRYSRMSDEQFRDHVAIIRENFQRIPVGERLPPLGTAVELEESREKYSEDVRRRALAIAKAKRERGEDVSFEEVLEAVRAGKQG